MSSKFLMISVILSLSLAAFLAGYLLSHSDFTKQSANIGADGILKKFDNSQASNDFSGDMVALSRGAVLSAVLSKEKDAVIYHDKSDGRVFQVNPTDLKENLISGTLLPDLMGTIWSPSKKEVVSVFYANNGERFKYYSYQTRKVVDFGTQVRSAVFSPDGSRLAYFKTQGLDGKIYTSAPDGDAPKKILDTRLTELDLYWPSKDNLAFKTEVGGRDNVFLLSATGNLTKLLDEDSRLDILWSPDGSQLLYSLKEGGKNALFVKNLSSSGNRSLDVSTTAPRCAWGLDGGYVICSVPRSGTTGEDIYKIGLDGTRELVASPKKSIVVRQLMLTVLEEFAVMVNDLDGKLYALKLR